MVDESINDKLSGVLRIFLSPGYSVTSTTYLDLLLTHIATVAISCDGDSSQQCNLLKTWISDALKIWNNGKKPSQPMIAFTLRLIGILGKNEKIFGDWKEHGIFNELHVTFSLGDEDLPATIKMAYTTMLLDITTHEIGRKWVINSGVWRDIVKYSQLNHTMYVTRESHKFICELLNKEFKNTQFCHQVIRLIAEPIINHTSDVQIHSALEDLYLDQTKVLCTTLDLLTCIFENTLFLSLDNTIPDMIENLVNLESRVKALFDTCISTRFLQYVHKLWILILFSKIKWGLKEDCETVDIGCYKKLVAALYYIHSMLLSKKYVIESVKTSKLALTYWKKLQALKPFQITKPQKFEHQGIALMITPMCVCFRKNYIHHEFKDMFLDKIFSLTSPSIQRLAYHTRDVVLKSDMPIEHIVKSSIDMLLDIVDIMDRDIAVMTFQSMCHVLKNYTPVDGNSDGMPKSDSRSSVDQQQRKPSTKSFLDGDPIVQHPKLLSTLLHGLALMTEKFQFKWPDCVETICILSLAEEILNHTGATPNLCVKALHLSRLAIENFMPPNLALLVDTHSDRKRLEHTLFKRLHDPNWEVRDSVLEVLNSIAVISEAKYPAYQDLLVSNNFIPIASDIATTDGESYVRASALILISTTIRINKLWDQVLSKLDLPDKMVKLYNEESEAIVRREAVTLIKELYMHRKWSKLMIDKMCKVMAEAAVMDFHWEVKVNALEYWRYFIKSNLTDQGMLDGVFPTITFSKEHRKIVTLNEIEIKRRLNKALDEMAKQNCLGVLLITLEDESDLEVSKSAADIISKFKTFLLKYKLNEPMPEQSIATKDKATIDTSYVKIIQEPSNSGTNEYINRSGIIDDIVDANDANLLASIYHNTMKMNEDNVSIGEKKLKGISEVTRQEFLHKVLNTDIENYIKGRQTWLTNYTVSLDSVLDDILTAQNQTAVNSLDCY